MADAPITTGRVAVGEYEFQLSESGDRSRPALLFLHGSGPGATGLSNWEAVLRDLGNDYYCVAPDVIGFGDSTHPEPPPRGLAAFTKLRVDTLMGLLDRLGLQRATFVGNSMGGMWSLGAALRAPERVERIVLMGSGGSPVPPGPAIPALAGFYDNPSTEAMQAMLEQFVYDPALFGGDLRKIAELRMPRALRPEVERSHRATFVDVMTEPWVLTAEEAARIRQEVLVVHGREDRFVVFDGGRWFFDHLPNVRLYGIGNCGHWTQIEQHDRFVAVVRGFVGGRL
ncbi:alpha/beta fold hydrolase [Streptomyces sp. NPDC101225]|uniref:alpha/beta fold hydrolase n=1 Tax=Streptomyces sp. NPDC101225 TaxID=3366135 RepID=UPI00380A888E